MTRVPKNQTNPSFTKGFLANHPHKHPVVNLIASSYARLNKAHTTFIDTILKHTTTMVRIHADINQLTKSDDGGTVTGRFSYAEPQFTADSSEK